MLTIYYQGKHAEMNVEELRILLQNSGLPWFKDEKCYYVVGYEKDLELRVLGL